MPTFKPTASIAVPQLPSLSFTVMQAIKNTKKATCPKGGSCLEPLFSAAAARVSGLKESDFSNFQVSAADALGRRDLQAGSSPDAVTVTYTVTVNPSEVSMLTPQSTYNLVKARLVSAVNNEAFTQALSTSAAKLGYTGMEQITTDSIQVSPTYQVIGVVGAANLSPTAAPVPLVGGVPATGSQSTGGASSASSGPSSAEQAGIAVGVVAAVVIVGAFAYFQYQGRSATGGAASGKQEPSKEVPLSAVRKYETHDFDSEPDSSVVSPMSASATRVVSHRDTIPMAAGGIDVAPKRL
jgi:hypothetical protein